MLFEQEIVARQQDNLAKQLDVDVVIHVHGAVTTAGAGAVSQAAVTVAGVDVSSELMLFAADIKERKNLKAINYFELTKIDDDCYFIIINFS